MNHITSFSREFRQARVESALEFLKTGFENAPDFAKAPWESRYGVLETYLKCEGIEAAEHFIEHGDNFLDGGWEDPVKTF